MPNNPFCTLATHLHRKELHLPLNFVGEDNALYKEGILFQKGIQNAFQCDCDKCVNPEVFIYQGKPTYICESNGCFVSLEFEEVALLEFNGNKLVEHLSKEFGCHDLKTIIPGKLWHLGECAFNIRSSKRTIYFARSLYNEPEVLNALPAKSKALLVLVGSERMCDLEEPLRIRTFCLQDILDINVDGEWDLDMEIMEAQLKSGKPTTRVARSSRNDKVAKIEQKLECLFNKLVAFNRRGQIKERDELMSKINIPYIAELTGLKEDNTRLILGKDLHKLSGR